MENLINKSNFSIWIGSIRIVGSKLGTNSFLFNYYSADNCLIATRRSTSINKGLELAYILQYTNGKAA